MTTYNPDGWVVCESSHLVQGDNWNYVATAVWIWTFTCENHAYDDTPAKRWLVGACRHEHVQKVPLCNGCARVVLEIAEIHGWLCGFCRDAGPPVDVGYGLSVGGGHDCRVVIQDAGTEKLYDPEKASPFLRPSRPGFSPAPDFPFPLVT